MKKIVLVSLAILLVVFESTGVRAANSGTTHWQVYAWIGQTVEDGVMTMTTTGTKVVAQFRGNAITGTLVDDGQQLNGDWSGPRGAGWLTVHFRGEGTRFNGSWGQKGKPADGKFVGNLITSSPAPTSQ